MPETFPTNLWTRAQWQKERDKAGVPKGAAKVSMGDAIDRFHKANAKGVRDGVKAAQSLQKDLQAYKTAVQKKYKPWHDRLVRMFEYDITSYLSDTAKLVPAVQAYSAKHTAATNEVRQLGAEFIHWEGDGANGTFKPSNEKAAVKALTEFVDIVKKMPFYTDKVTKAAAKTFDQTVYAASAGNWNKPTVEGLMNQLAHFRGSV